VAIKDHDTSVVYTQPPLMTKYLSEQKLQPVMDEVHHLNN